MTTNSTVRLEDAMLTMDVVDRLRHRDSELQSLAANEGGTQALKERLAAIYRSQGIEVPEDILEAGIQAQRDQRYIYNPPTGASAWLAHRWIDRKRLGKIGSIVALATALTGGIVQFAVLMPMEYVEQRGVDDFNAQAAELPGRLSSLDKQLSKSVADLQAVIVNDVHALDRLKPARIELRSAHDANVKRAREQLQQLAPLLPIPQLKREDGKTVATNATSAIGAPETYAQQQLAKAQALAVGIEANLQALTEAAKTYSSLSSASEQIDTANAAAVDAHLPPPIDSVRRRVLAEGDTAVRGMDPKAARSAARRLGTLPKEAAAVEATAQKIADLRTTALGTGVRGKDLEVLEAAFADAIAVNTIDSQGRATESVARLESLAEALAGSYSYRIVNRSGTRSGVWRQHDKSPGVKNFYLVVEALDQDGRAKPLPILNEETGKTEVVTIFGVRVPEDAFHAVAADKKDNGLIENDLLATKPRGTLTPEFAMPVQGGYITHW